MLDEREIKLVACRDSWRAAFFCFVMFRGFVVILVLASVETTLANEKPYHETHGSHETRRKEEVCAVLTFLSRMLKFRFTSGDQYEDCTERRDYDARRS